MLHWHSSVPLQVQALVQTFHSGSFSESEKSMVVVTIGENNQKEHGLVKKDLFAVMRKKQSWGNPLLYKSSSQYLQNTGGKLVSMRRSNQADKRTSRERGIVQHSR